MMTKEQKTRSNKVIETIHWFLWSWSEFALLPPLLLVQMDSCTCENKNRSMFAYFESLFSSNISKNIDVGSLAVGNTHEYIDQAFSHNSESLKNNDAITLPDLHDELRPHYKNSIAAPMQSLANWSFLGDQENVLTTVTQYRYFRFHSLEIGTEKKPPFNHHPPTSCPAQINYDNVWTDLQ